MSHLESRRMALNGRSVKLGYGGYPEYEDYQAILPEQVENH